jgi:hypothetical protein
MNRAITGGTGPVRRNAKRGGAECDVRQGADRHSALRCSVPAADSSGRHVAGGGVTGTPVTRKALGTEKETAEAEENGG